MAEKGYIKEDRTPFGNTSVQKNDLVKSVPVRESRAAHERIPVRRIDSATSEVTFNPGKITIQQTPSSNHSNKKK